MVRARPRRPSSLGEFARQNACAGPGRAPYGTYVQYHRYGRWPSPRSLALTLQQASLQAGGGEVRGRRRRPRRRRHRRGCGADRGALARARPRVPQAPRRPGRRPGGEIRRAGTPNAIEGVQIDPKPHAGFSPFKHVKKHYIENPMRVVKTINIEVHTHARHRVTACRFAGISTSVISLK